MTALEMGTGPRAGAGDRRRVPRLEGIRGLCALGVIVYHVAFAAGVTSLLPIQGDGFWGILLDGLSVSLPPFFVLSGLLLYRPFARAIIAGTHRPAVGPFLWRRALRILP